MLSSKTLMRRQKGKMEDSEGGREFMFVGGFAYARHALEESASLAKVNIHLARTPHFGSQKRGMSHVKARWPRGAIREVTATYDASLLGRKMW